jgi:hypothetical protein
MLPTTVSFYYQKHVLKLHLVEGRWGGREENKRMSHKKKTPIMESADFGM